MKTIFGALALCGMAFALSGNAAGQTPIGEWLLVKVFCEGDKVANDVSESRMRRIFDKASMTRTYVSEEDCALQVKTNYSITGNQYKLGPFLELISPNCPDISEGLRESMKYSMSYLNKIWA